MLHDSPHGAPAYPPLVMVKGLLLQQWYGLSDPGLEEALWDRLSFRVFCGLPLGETAPNYSTINRFRNALREKRLDEQLFDAVNCQLDGRGLMLRKGMLIDASLVPAAVTRRKSPKSLCRLDRTARCPASWSTARAIPKRNGPRRAAGVISATRPCRRRQRLGDHPPVKLTGASVNDTVPADELICGDEAAVYADAAYHTLRREQELTERGIEAAAATSTTR